MLLLLLLFSFLYLVNSESWVVPHNGLIINGIIYDELSGISISSAGDFNNDGYNDIIIGTNGLIVGQVFIVYGGPNMANIDKFDALTIDGTNGLIINAINITDHCGFSVSYAGDVNGDGIDDIIIGAYSANNNNGQIYIIYGSENFPHIDGEFYLTDLSSSFTNGIIIDGIEMEQLGYSVSSAGDFNGDGYDDVVIGANYGNKYTGRAYIIFGKGDLESFIISSLDGTNGLILNGIVLGDFCGYSVSTAGDFNNDGFGDVVIGTEDAKPNGLYSGQAYLLYGRSDYDIQFVQGEYNLTNLNGTFGFIIDGGALTGSGKCVALAGDFNDDGIDDLLIGAKYAEDVRGNSYIIWGNPNIELVNGRFLLTSLIPQTGLILKGHNLNDQSGYSLSNIGDYNNDGVDDIIIGAPYASPNGKDSGEVYIVLGGKDISTKGIFELKSLNGKNGYIFKGRYENDNVGYSVGNAGNFFGNNKRQIMIGAPNAVSYKGQTYIISPPKLSKSNDALIITLEVLGFTIVFVGLGFLYRHFYLCPWEDDEEEEEDEKDTEVINLETKKSENEEQKEKLLEKEDEKDTKKDEKEEVKDEKDIEKDKKEEEKEIKEEEKEIKEEV